MKNESKAKKLVAVTLGAVMTFSLVACGGNGGGEASHNHTYSNSWAHTDTHHYHEATCGHDVKPEDSDGYAKHIMQNGECTVCDYVASITLAEFVSDYKTKAQQFVNFTIRPIVVEDREVKAEQWYIAGNSNNALSEINIVYTYTVNSTDRKIEIASAKPTTPIPFKDIVDNNYTINASALEIDRTNAFTFNAKTNYNKQELSSALFAKAGIKTSDLYPNTIYKEIESTNESTRSFELLEQSNGKIAIKTLTTEKGNGSDSDLLDYLYGPKTKVTDSATYEIDGTSIYNSTYTLENLGQEEEKPDPEKPDPTGKIESVQDLITNYGAEVKAALEDNYLYNMGKQCIGRAFNTDKVLDSEWHVNSGENLSKIDVVFRYDEGNGYTSYRIGTIELNSPINVKDLTKDTIASILAENSSNATYTQSYAFSYNNQMATERSELKNAICDKFFGENEGATRFIIDEGPRGTDPTLGEVRDFKVVEISEDGVKEISITIKNSANDNEYINKLYNSSNYYTDNEKSYDISGEKVEESKTSEAKTNTQSFTA